MTLAFLRLSTDERKLYIDEAAARRGLSPIILEKDFWVCWLLGCSSSRHSAMRSSSREAPCRRAAVEAIVRSQTLRDWSLPIRR